MKIPYSWLKDYVEIRRTPEQLADDLSLFGHEVESIEKIGKESVLDFEITPNRGDCLSILGMAREIAALYNQDVKHKQPHITLCDMDKDFGVVVSNPKLCLRYTARIINNIKITSSPKWLKERLALAGFRPINNVVDITNYIMIETGQPLHAFDYDKINTVGKKKLLNIRQAKTGEKVTTLDNKERKLNQGALIIEDDQKIYDLAGIMGGFNSQVDSKTRNIILQGAIFDPVTIRKASKFLNHVTDASYRYERGVDFKGTVYAINLATELILKTNKVSKAGKLFDKIFYQYPETKITILASKINNLLGTKFSQIRINEYLTRLNFEVDSDQVTPPSYRYHDVKIWQDIAEEVARIYGYNNLAKHQIEKSNPKKTNTEWQIINALKDIISSQGYNEVYSYSFISKKELDLFKISSDQVIEVKKPLSPETQYLRPDILPSILKQISKNPWAPVIKVFEIENCFTKDKEFTQLIIAQNGSNKKQIEGLVSNIQTKCEILSVDQKILDYYKIRRPVIYTRIDIESLVSQIKKIPQKYNIDFKQIKYQPISKFPPTVRDLAFIVDKKVDTSKIIEEIKNTDKKILIVELFDEFMSDKFGSNKKNVAYHIWIQDLEKSPNEKEVNSIVDKILRRIEKKFSAKLRS
ncbi:MAG: phenylalanine--tRNA ligase subunit beta [Candidatus Berkelbacteria bacterium]|nr:phenylalanine--tRNA ligase subunit beta [Candidatus Berkelbacteria bacterium]